MWWLCRTRTFVALPILRERAVRLLGSRRWKRASAEYLVAHRWCVPCERAKARVRATVVHHKKPHRNVDLGLFWDRRNWEARCGTCHADAMGPEATGRPERYRGASVDGTPLDPGHRWNHA